MVFRGPQLPLVLCLIIRRVFSHFSDLNEEMVLGNLNQPVSLNCIYVIPNNWLEKEAQILWFRNFTSKILDCVVKEGKKPICQNTHFSSRTQLSTQALYGNAALQFSHFQDSDIGPYECWVIFSQSYQRRDIMLKLRGEVPDVPIVHSNRWEPWNEGQDNFPWNILLMSGWLVALLLTGIIISQKYFLRVRRKYMISI